MALDDNALMERVKLKDALAFECLMKRHRRGVLRFLAYFVGNAETAADLTQDTFLRVYLKANMYKPIGSFKTWLYRVARNLAISHLRRHAVKRLFLLRDDQGKPTDIERLLPPASSRSPEQNVMNLELASIISQALKGLTPKLREAFLLCDVMGMNLAEISTITGATSSTIKVRVFRARIALRKILIPYLETASKTRIQTSFNKAKNRWITAPSSSYKFRTTPIHERGS